MSPSESTATIKELEGKFLSQKARVQEGSILTEVNDGLLYPYKTDPVLFFDLGEPFEGFLRVPLNADTEGHMYEAIYDFYNQSFTSFDQISQLELTIDNRSISRSGTPEKQELEIPVIVRGREAVVTKVYPLRDYKAKEQHDMEELSTKAAEHTILYHELKRTLEGDPSVLVDTVDAISDSTIQLTVTLNSHTLPIRFNLPGVDGVETHSSTVFIDNFGSGRIRSLEGNEVYIGPSEDTLGEDTIFNEVGVYPEYPPPSKNGIIDTLKSAFK